MKLKAIFCIKKVVKREIKGIDGKKIKNKLKTFPFPQKQGLEKYKRWNINVFLSFPKKKTAKTLVKKKKMAYY